MSVASTIEAFLARRAIAYDVLTHPGTESLEQAAEAVGIPPRQMARAVVLRVEGTDHMAVLPLSHILDFAALEEKLGGVPEPVAADELSERFSDCERGSLPPVGDAYGIPTCYDESLFDVEFVAFEGGTRNALLRLDRENLRRLSEGAEVGRFSRPVESLECVAGDTESQRGVEGLAPNSELKKRLEAIYELPPMPVHAHQILALRGNDDASAADLAAVVETDPSLAAQVLRYARSPFFGYRGKVDSLQDAIARVLGFDVVMNLALGLASLKPFKIPPDGPLGLRAFWRHAAYSGALCQRLGRLMPRDRQPKAGLLYLAGLLHNFGYLVFGHLFQPEFFLLNRMAAANPKVPVPSLEKQVLCMGHAKDVMCLGHANVGGWLLHSWEIPEEVVVAAREHHNPKYRGEHEQFAHLVLVADHLLKAHGIGDGSDDAPPAEVLDHLGLRAEQVRATTAELMENASEVEATLGPDVE